MTQRVTDESPGRRTGSNPANITQAVSEERLSPSFFISDTQKCQKYLSWQEILGFTNKNGLEQTIMDPPGPLLLLHDHLPRCFQSEEYLPPYKIRYQEHFCRSKIPLSSAVITSEQISLWGILHFLLHHLTESLKHQGPNTQRRRSSFTDGCLLRWSREGTVWRGCVHSQCRDKQGPR